MRQLHAKARGYQVYENGRRVPKEQFNSNIASTLTPDGKKRRLAKNGDKWRAIQERSVARRGSREEIVRGPSLKEHGEGVLMRHHLRQGLGPPGKLSSSNRFCAACKKDVESFGGVVGERGRTATWPNRTSREAWKGKEKEYARSGTPPYPEYQAGRNSKKSYSGQSYTQFRRENPGAKLADYARVNPEGAAYRKAQSKKVGDADYLKKNPNAKLGSKPGTSWNQILRNNKKSAKPLLHDELKALHPAAYEKHRQQVNASAKNPGRKKDTTGAERQRKYRERKKRREQGLPSDSESARSGRDRSPPSKRRKDDEGDPRPPPFSQPLIVGQ